MNDLVNKTWEKEGTLVAAGKRLEYACFGQPPNEAPTLVLLHEGLGCTHLWRDFPRTLANATGFGVFAYSRAGYGKSAPAELPRPLDYMTREAMDVLPLVLDAIGIEAGVLLGHSDGGTIAAIHVGCIADRRIIGAVLVAPHFFTETASLVEIAKARDAFNTGDLRERLAKYHHDPDNAFLGWNDSWLHPDFKAWNVTDVLDDIRVPVLAVQGRDDPYGTLAQIDIVSERVTKAPVTKLILDNCRHAPHREHGPAVVAELVRFCRELDTKQSTSSAVE